MGGGEVMSAEESAPNAQRPTHRPHCTFGHPRLYNRAMSVRIALLSLAMMLGLSERGVGQQDTSRQQGATQKSGVRRTRHRAPKKPAASDGAARDSAPPWPTPPTPLPGSILPQRRIVAFYGNPLS